MITYADPVEQAVPKDHHLPAGERAELLEVRRLLAEVHDARVARQMVAAVPG